MTEFDEAFGSFLKLGVRGASHASALRVTLANFPGGFRLNAKALAAFMARRAPGRDALSTARREADEVRFLRGLAGGATTGETLVAEIANTDARAGDYGSERTVPRPGHADFGQWVAEGRIPTGGGKNSGRLTAALCAAGGLCKQFLEARGICVSAAVETVAGEATCFEKRILAAKRDGDSVGGTIRCVAKGLPPGLGGALFAGLESALSSGLFAIPGVKGVAFGNGFDACGLSGSENDDAFAVRNGVVTTKTNRHGGLLGGRTTSMPLELTVALKPTPTVFKPLASVDLATMRTATCAMKGRHDPCIVLRAVPVVEAVVAFALADALLADEAAHPRICLTLTGRTLDEDLAQLRSQLYFTDMVELRADLLDADECRRVAEFPARLAAVAPWRIPALLTFRRTRDGGAYAGGEKTRVAFFRRALKGFAFVDFEEDFRVAALERLARREGVRIVRSRHDFTGAPKDFAATCRALVAGTDEIAKIAFRPKGLGDVARLFAAAERMRDVPHIVCAMGPQGVVTRALAVRLGSRWTYASVGGLESLGHLTPHELVKTYRLRTVGASAELYGVTGWPLAVTRSPELHNAAFASEDRDAVMVPLPAKRASEAIAFMRALGLRGLAVTIPHKFGVMPLLDTIDPAARRIGAVNTILRDARGLHGFNTDADGFLAALTAFAGDLGGKTAAILGDGGAAQAVKRALAKAKVRYRVFHRQTPPPGFDLIVNATPVDPIPDYAFTGRELVYDLRYVPEETPLMARARAAGCRVANGFGMLVEQARRQREIWGRS